MPHRIRIPPRDPKLEQAIERAEVSLAALYRVRRKILAQEKKKRRALRMRDRIERPKAANAFRLRGMTYAEIGRRLGVCGTEAKRLVWTAIANAPFDTEPSIREGLATGRGARMLPGEVNSCR